MPGYGVPDQLRKTSFAYTFHPNRIVASIAIDGPQAGTLDRTVQNFNAFGELTSIADAKSNTTTYSNYNTL
ncbi:MAG: hypothetical protein ACT4QA_14635 [Panacagrimonas sp.]